MEKAEKGNVRDLCALRKDPVFSFLRLSKCGFPRSPCGTIPPMSEPASIVIIEDDADINEVVAVHLRCNGFACTQAFSGSEGRLLLSGSEPFDLVITDLMLPGMTGEDVVRLVRARGDVPVIVMSARTTAADKVALLKLGADDYLTKGSALNSRPGKRNIRLKKLRPSRKTRKKLRLPKRPGRPKLRCV